MPNTVNLSPSAEGGSRKIRRGRPKNPDILQQLAQDIGYEPVDIDRDQVALTQLKAILHDWLNSKDFRKQRALVELVYGKVPANNRSQKQPKTTKGNFSRLDDHQTRMDTNPHNDHPIAPDHTLDDNDPDL